MNLGDRMVMKQAVKMLKALLPEIDDDDIAAKTEAVIGTLKDRIALGVTE